MRIIPNSLLPAHLGVSAERRTSRSHPHRLPGGAHTSSSRRRSCRGSACGRGLRRGGVHGLHRSADTGDMADPPSHLRRCPGMRVRAPHGVGRDALRAAPAEVLGAGHALTSHQGLAAPARRRHGRHRGRGRGTDHRVRHDDPGAHDRGARTRAGRRAVIALCPRGSPRERSRAGAAGCCADARGARAAVGPRGEPSSASVL